MAVKEHNACLSCPHPGLAPLSSEPTAPALLWALGSPQDGDSPPRSRAGMPAPPAPCHHLPPATRVSTSPWGRGSPSPSPPLQDPPPPPSFHCTSVKTCTKGEMRQDCSSSYTRGGGGVMCAPPKPKMCVCPPRLLSEPVPPPASLINRDAPPPPGSSAEVSARQGGPPPGLPSPLRALPQEGCPTGTPPPPPPPPKKKTQTQAPPYPTCPPPPPGQCAPPTQTGGALAAPGPLTLDDALGGRQLVVAAPGHGEGTPANLGRFVPASPLPSPRRGPRRYFPAELKRVPSAGMSR